MGCDLRVLQRVHQLLAARAYLNVALHAIRYAKLYLNSSSDGGILNEVRYVEDVVESIVSKIEGRLGSVVFGNSRNLDEGFTSKVRKVITEVVFDDDHE